MSYLSKVIITNVEASYIETFLKQKGIARTDEEQGQELVFWGGKLIDNHKIDVEEFENFLFDELFWGKRKNIRIYKLEKVSRIKYPKDWLEPLEEKYKISSLNFNNILDTIVDQNNPMRIVAIHSEVNFKGELVRIRILFSLYIQVNGDGGYVDSGTYIPVEIDFAKKIMIIKGWNRQQISHEDNKVGAQIEHIKKLMNIQFGVRTLNYEAEHKKVLYAMSRHLIYDVYSNIPTFNQVDDLEELIKKFVQNIYQQLALKNVYIDEMTGKSSIPEGVMDFESEIKNTIEGLAISDHFYSRNFDEIWKMGLEAVVAKVKFNDRERVLTSLNGENNDIPIFCTKTFMTLKKRMEESKKIETLWIAMDRKKGNLNLKFEATNPEYLEVMIRYGIRFNELDMNSALEIYEKYESELINKITTKGEIAVG